MGRAILVIVLSTFLAASIAIAEEEKTTKGKPQSARIDRRDTAKTALDKSKQPLAKPTPKSTRLARDVGPLVAIVDREWAKALETAKVPASPEADDAEFLRRASLDLTGRIPTYERTVAFLASTDPNKRRELVDELLASREFGVNFGQKWRLLIMPRDTGSSKQPADRFTPWLADQLAADRPWSEIVTELLTTEGDFFRDASATLFLANNEESSPKPSLLAASVGRLFLGVQVGCAECHNHPFAEWTQDEFWGLAAFFGRVRKKSKGDARLTEDPPENAARVVFVVPEGAGKFSGQAVAPRFLNGGSPEVTETTSLRPALAAWLTSRENPYFAKATVNRIWAQLFGRGIVQPVDDFRAENAPSHPELLNALAREFVESGFEVKHILRAICNSRAYQRTSRPLPENEADTTLFSRAAVKVMAPEMLYDSLHVVLNTRTKPVERGGKKPNGFVLTIEPRDAFVRSFARSAEVDLGEQFAYGVPQLLRLLNAPEYNILPPFIADQIGAGTSQVKLIETLYLVALSRWPTSQEVERMQRLMGTNATEQSYAGALWVLLNSSEFVLNH
jgi:hypothetical protein